jgi:hypothetical protein
MDIEYYRVRAAAELAMASASNRINVAAVHQELARLYQALVEKAEPRPISSVGASYAGQLPA